MTRRFGLLCISVLALVGCDHFPGPGVRNEFPAPAHITVSYTDGETWTNELQPCESMLLGAVEAGRWGMQPKKGVSINELTITVEGEVVHRFDKTTIDRLIEKEREQPGSPVWVVDRSGIRFSTEKECSLAQGP